MTYATVMASLSLDRSNDACLEIAGQLAERFSACAVGITAGELSPPLYFTTGEQAKRVIDRGQAAIRNRLTEVEAQFRAAMLNRAAAVEWRCAEDFPTRFIIQQARPPTSLSSVRTAARPLRTRSCRPTQATF
jgi:hypothetical protein